MTAPDPTRTTRILLGTAFTGAGIAHVVKHEFFENLVPDSLARWRKPISAATAVIQFVGGISMFVPRLRVLARWTNLAMLVPTLPAAVAQTRHPDQMRALGVNPKLVIARIPAQLLVATVTWWGQPAHQPTSTTDRPFGGDAVTDRKEPDRCGNGSNTIGAQSGSVPRSCCCCCCSAPARFVTTLACHAGATRCGWPG